MQNLDGVDAAPFAARGARRSSRWSVNGHDSYLGSPDRRL
jgi:hypothetical protein